jgi:hypothetical protein
VEAVLRFYARCVLIALISSGMLVLQTQWSVQAAPVALASGKAAAEPPLAVIALADRAHVGSANASNGTTVYPGDSLDTAPGGELRLTVGAGQVYLLSDSAANITRNGGILRASIRRGTVGFSSLAAQQFEIDTPEGLLHAANGLPAYGQVTISGPKDIVVSAYTGTLALERGDQKLLINAGQSYYVSLVPDPESVGQRKAGVVPALNEHLVWRLIIIGGAALVGYFLWRHFSESPTDPK